MISSTHVNLILSQQLSVFGQATLPANLVGWYLENVAGLKIIGHSLKQSRLESVESQSTDRDRHTNNLCIILSSFKYYAEAWFKLKPGIILEAYDNCKYYSITATSHPINDPNEDYWYKHLQQNVKTVILGWRPQMRKKKLNNLDCNLLMRR